MQRSLRNPQRTAETAQPRGEPVLHDSPCTPQVIAFKSFWAMLQEANFKIKYCIENKNNISEKYKWINMLYLKIFAQIYIGFNTFLDKAASQSDPN